MKRTQRHSGFTIIEVVIALAVLIIGLVSVIAVIPMGQRSAKDAAVITQAATVASEKIAEIKAYGFEAASQATPPFALSGETEGIAWTIEIRDAQPTDFEAYVPVPVDHLKYISVTVSYKVYFQTKQETFSCFLAKF